MFCSLQYLKVEHSAKINIDQMLLSSDVRYVNTWIKQNPIVVEKFGHIYLKVLLQNPFFVSCVLDETEVALLIQRANLSNLQTYFEALWLVKDNSVNIDRYFMQRIEEPFNRSSTGSVLFSNREGLFEDTHFTNEELVSALAFMDKLKLIRRPKPASEHPPIEQAPTGDFRSGISPGRINEDNYNDSNRASRALMFVEVARTTTHLPAKIASMVASLECLFSDSKVNISDQVANRAARYVCSSTNEISPTVQFLKKEMYDFRSRYIHGDKLKKIKSSTNELLPRVIRMDDLMRQILVKVIDVDLQTFVNDKASKAFLQSLYKRQDKWYQFKWPWA